MHSPKLEPSYTESLATIGPCDDTVSLRDRTWQICWRRQSECLASHASDILPEFLEGAFRLGLPSFRLPDIRFLSTAIGTAGWGVQPVEGFIPSREYFRIITERQVPLAKNLRSLADAEHSPQPDMLHDIFGHLPMVFSDDMMRLNLAIANAGIAAPISNLEMDHYAADLLSSHLKAAGITAVDVVAAAQARVTDLERRMALDPSIFDQVRKIYLWAIEFGVMSVAGRPRAFGAGLLSSRAELARFSSGQTPILPFDAKVLVEEINFIGHQKQFFLIRDLDDVYRVLDQVVSGGVS